MNENDRTMRVSRNPVKKARKTRALRSIGKQLAILCVLVLAWQVFCWVFQLKSYILPSPVEVAQAMVRNWPQIRNNIPVTVYEILTGYFLTVVISIPAAALIARSQVFEDIIYPILLVMQIIPKVAIAPLFIIWFGFGTMPKVLLTFLLSFFPLLMDAIVGFKSLNPRLHYMARTMSESEWKFFWHIRFPNAMPHVFSGLKTSMAFATVGAIVAEFVGSSRGLGYLLLRANGDLDTKYLFALIIILSLIGIIFYKIIEFIEYLASPWHVSQRREILAANHGR